MEGELVNALPLIVLFPPNEDAAIVGRRGEDGTELGVSPRNRPHGTLVALECLGQAVLFAFNLEDLDRFVGGAGRESPAVVVENRIVLQQTSLAYKHSLPFAQRIKLFLSHTIMSSCPELEITCALSTLASHPFRRWSACFDSIHTMFAFVM